MGKKKKRKVERPPLPESGRPRPPIQGTETRRRGYGTKLIIVCLALAALTATGFLFLRHGKQVQSGGYKDFNVLFITLDTTRADHLPMYGYDHVKTPGLDRLAKESYVFDDGISHVPLTLPSHTTMLTGILPITHGVRDNSGYFVDKKITTLPELLKSHGYVTSAFVSAFVLDSRWQLSQGFDLYYDNFNLEEFKQLNPQDAQRPAEETEAEAEHWLQANKDKKFFSWVHFYDPHDPYDPPEPFKTEYSGNPYDGEIAYMDVAIGKLLDKIDSLGLTKKTIVVVTGDHGEALGDHDEATHAMFVYNSTQHIPYLIHVPGTASGHITGVVRHIDLFPTIIDLLGFSGPKDLQGSTLVPLMNHKKEKERIAYSESIYAELHYGWSPLASITTNHYKYIDAPKPELYDRIQDPQELRNLITEKANYAKALRDQLNETAAKYTSKMAQGPQKMDPETEERLRSLGYIGSTVQSTAESRKIDPKDKIHLARDLQIASTHTTAQRYKEAINTLLPIIKEDPSMTDAHFMAGVSYIGLKDYDKGIDELLKTLALRSDHTMAIYNIGYAYEGKGDKQQAIDWYLKVFKYEPKHLYASLRVAHLYRELNEPEKARPYFMDAVGTYERFLANTKTDKAKSALHSTLGEIYFGAGHLADAEKHFKAAIDLTPERDTLHYNLAMIYESEGNVQGAMEEYQRETQVDSENFKAFNNLGLLYRHAGQLDRAAMCFQRVVQLLPEDPRGYVLLASTLKDMGRLEEANEILKKGAMNRAPTN
jgi:arylsulfatase A-like enzyme/Tfp pilus assembly protein PilF